MCHRDNHYAFRSINGLDIDTEVASYAILVKGSNRRSRETGDK